ncbi:MAG: VWA domain-containing protein [Acidobacteriota bacterium]|nr:VWA domain-containing protein [Acidobacteriota bacterium]
MMYRLCLLLFALNGFGQDVVQEQISVILRDVRVHVVYRDGKPVTGLKADDFILKEGRQTRSLSFFEEVDHRTGRAVTPKTIDLTRLGEGGAVVQPDGRVVILLLDTSNIGPDAFEPIIEAAQELVRAEVRPGVKMKILHFDETLKHLSPFSDDVDMLADCLLLAEYKGEFRRTLINSQDLIVEHQEELDRRLEALDPQEIANLERRVEEAIIEKERLKLEHFRSYYNQMEAMAMMLGQHPHAKAIYHLSGGVYLQPAGGQYMNTRGQAARLGKMLNRRNVTVYSFVQADRRPIGEFLSPGLSLSNLPADTSGNSQYEDYFQLQSGPLKLAVDTGGFFARADGKASISREVVNLQDSSRHYYRLVYTVDAASSGERIRIELAGNRRNLKLHYGKRFGRKRPWKRLNRVDRQLSFETYLLFSRETRNELDCRYSFYRFRGEDGQVLIPVTIDLPPEPRPKKGFEVGLAAVGAAEEVYDVTQTTLTKLPPDKGLRLHHVLVADGDPDVVRFYVRNLDTGAFSLHEAVTAGPLYTTEKFHISEVVLSQYDDYRLLPLNMMEKPGKAAKKITNPRDRRSADPLVIRNMLVRGRPEIYSGEPLNVFFHLNGLKGSPADLVIDLSISREGRELKTDFRQLSLMRVEGSLRVYGQIPKLDSAPGRYKLTIRAAHPETGEAHGRNVPLTIAN